MGDSTFDEYKKENEEEIFYEFVNQNIEKLKKYSELDGTNIKFDDVNFILCNYSQIYFTLLSLSTFAQAECDKEQEIFDDWFADKYIIIRNRENRSDLAAQKWLGHKEIEMLVRNENKEEYATLKSKLRLAERKLVFTQQMLKSWESQQFILNTLSKNIQTEISVSIKS